MTKQTETTFHSDAHINDACGILQVYHYSSGVPQSGMAPKALTLWNAPISTNSILYMYLHVLLKYNARVAVRAQQLTRRRVEIHDLAHIRIIARPIMLT